MVEQSVDGTNWDYASTWTASANVGLAAYAHVVARYGRVVWINGATGQTVFRFGGRYSIPASNMSPLHNPYKQNPKPELYYTKKVSIKNVITGKEEKVEHIFLRCTKTGREIDTMTESFWGHSEIPDLVLCEEAYIELAFGVKLNKWKKLKPEERIALVKSSAKKDWAKEFK